MAADPKYEAVIGLEVHAQIVTRTKMFCGCRADHGLPPNVEVCPVCLGLPGALPVVNSEAIRLAAIGGLALGARVSEESVFARKNYFYPDLPKGYQISQYEKPFAVGGQVVFNDGNREIAVPLERLNLEEDAGKSLHFGTEDKTGIDFNRCGIPLLEIVSAPAICELHHAYFYLVRLKQILEYTGVCAGSMELGNLRCDANVSVRPIGQRELGTKTELKNLNSFHNVARALAHEFRRQTDIVERGELVKHETRLWDAARQVSVEMRSKEEVNDYRYFPEPDLVRIRLARKYLDSLGAALPELPHRREKRLVAEHGLPAYDAGVLVSTQRLADYYEEVAKLTGDPKAASNWIMTEVLRVLNEKRIGIDSLGLVPRDIADLLGMIKEGRISGKIAKDVFAEMIALGKGASAIVEARGLSQINDGDAIRNSVRQVIGENPLSVGDFKKGKERAFRFLVGKVMERTRGMANPTMVHDILKGELET